MHRTLPASLLLLTLISAPATPQDPLKLLPANYKLTFSNPAVTVIRAHYGPHEKLPVHDHTSFSTVFVYLNASGPVRIDHAEPGEEPHSVTRPPTTLGSYRVAPGIVERHSIENLSATPSDFLRIELKHVSLDLKEPFRGQAPKSLAGDSDTTEFTSPGLQIERVLCAGPTPCPVKPNPAPSLLVDLPSGAVRWLPAATAGSIPVPGHILRILLPAS